MIAAGELLEWAEVNGNRYGTPKAPVMAAMEAGKDVLFDIDWQGAAAVADKAPDDSVRVFVLPPSWSDLSRRLHARAQDSEAAPAVQAHSRRPRGQARPRARARRPTSRRCDDPVPEGCSRAPRSRGRTRTRSAPGGARSEARALP